MPENRKRFFAIGRPLLEFSESQPLALGCASVFSITVVCRFREPTPSEDSAAEGPPHRSQAYCTNPEFVCKSFRPTCNVSENRRVLFAFLCKTSVTIRNFVAVKQPHSLPREGNSLRGVPAGMHPPFSLKRKRAVHGPKETLEGDFDFPLQTSP